MLTDKGIRKRYSKTQFSKKNTLPKDYKFPTSFQHITSELDQIIE